eukprot:COSAG06_NODE_244_length_19215_cov_20.256853_14_plen_132_part_00
MECILVDSDLQRPRRVHGHAPAHFRIYLGLQSETRGNIRASAHLGCQENDLSPVASPAEHAPASPPLPLLGASLLSLSPSTTPDRHVSVWGGAYLATCPYLLSYLKCQAGRFERRAGRFECRVGWFECKVG